MEDKHKAIAIAGADLAAIAEQARTREARLAQRIVRVSQGRERDAQCNNAQRERVVQRLRARLLRMVEAHDREGVRGSRMGGYHA